MKTILLLLSAFLGFTVAFAAPVVPTTMASQCPDASNLKSFVANQDPTSVFVSYAPNNPMYRLIQSASDIAFFRAYIDNGIMKCSYSSTNRLLVLEMKPELANAAFVNPTMNSMSSDQVRGITACTVNVPDQCRFDVKQ